MIFFLLDFCVRISLWDVREFLKIIAFSVGFIDNLNEIFRKDLRTKYDNFDAQSTTFPPENTKWIMMKTKGSPKVIRNINIKICTQKNYQKLIIHKWEIIIQNHVQHWITRTEKAQKMRNWNRLFNWIQHVFPIFYRNFFSWFCK